MPPTASVHLASAGRYWFSAGRYWFGSGISQDLDELCALRGVSARAGCGVVWCVTQQVHL